MRIGIIGAGAIGMHVAAQLHMAGRNVTLVCRTNEQMNQLSTTGLSYWNMEGEKKQLFIPVQSGNESTAFDILLITIKQTHFEAALPSITRLSASHTTFVCFQNGLGHEEVMKHHFPYHPLFLAVTTEGALKIGIDEVRHTGRGITRIGSADRGREGTSVKNQVEELVNLFVHSGMVVVVEEDIYEKIWKKLLVNVCINPLTAILKVNNGQLSESHSTLLLIERLFSEGRKVAEQEGVHIPEDYLQEVIQVCKTTYYNKSSMLQDIEASRLTEIDYINGAVKRIADRSGIDIPYNRTMIDLVHAKQDFSKKQGT